MNISSVLVTGTQGFIGQVLLQKLQTLPIKIKVLVRNSAAIHGVETQRFDLTHTWPCNPCIGVDTVFHLAAKVHHLNDSMADIAAYQRVNTEVTQQLLAAAQQAGVRKFIYLSSVKAVGDSVKISDELLDTPPTTAYGRSKYDAEQEVIHGNYVPHPVVIRPCMVYGNTHKGHLPQMIRAIAGGWFPPLPAIDNRRSMIHVADVVQAILLAAHHSQAAGQTYIVTDGQVYSTQQLYEWIYWALKKPLPRIKIPLVWLSTLAKIADQIELFSGRNLIFNSDKWEKLTASAEYSSAKIQRELTFQPRYQLQTSIAEIVTYLQSPAQIK
jgi:UDP-glucose 4-epimerase